MRIVTQVIAVIATVIVTASVIWSIAIFSQPYDGSIIQIQDINDESEESTVTGSKLYGSWENAYQELRFDADGVVGNQIIKTESEADEDLNDSLVAFHGVTQAEYSADDIRISVTNEDVYLTDDSNLSYFSISFNYYFADEDELVLTNNTSIIRLSRNINRVRSYEEMINHSYEKVNISGLFEFGNETNAYLTVNGTDNETKVMVLLEGNNQTNISDFDGQNVSIIGYLYVTCDCSYWDGPCIKDVELISVIQ